MTSTVADLTRQARALSALSPGERALLKAMAGPLKAFMVVERPASKAMLAHLDELGFAWEWRDLRSGVAHWRLTDFGADAARLLGEPMDWDRPPD